MPLILRADSLSKGYLGRTLFSGVSIAFDDDQRVGLVGPNGAGKSTLLKILAGIITPDEGLVERVGNARVGYVEQEDRFERGATPESVLLAASADLPGPQPARRARVGAMLGRLGFEDAAQVVETLSGGWRKRLALGRELVSEPDLLLMDEPTNHLDIEGIEWLEDFLARTNQAYVVVSHDRRFLQGVTDRTVELNPRYEGGYYSVPAPYDEFVKKREALFHTQENRRRALAGLVRQEAEWLRRGPKARGTKADFRVREARRMMADLKDLKGRIAGDRSIDLALNTTERRTNDLVVVENVARAMGGRELFSGLTFTLSPGTRMGIVGNNGTGKTTLLRVLAAELEPDHGRVKHAKRLRVSVFGQGREQLDDSITLRRALAPTGDIIDHQGNEIHVQGWAERFLFRPEQLDRYVGELSGGEKARIMLANLMRRPADVLLLDEPTNDLDIPSVEQLEQSLLDFPGAVAIITHDRRMLDSVCTEIVGLHRDGSSSLYASVSQWQVRERQVAEDLAAQARREKEQRRRERARSTITHDELKALNRIEGRIQKAEAHAEALREQVESGEFSDDHVKLAELLDAWNAARAAVDALYDRWAELEARRGG